MERKEKIGRKSNTGREGNMDRGMEGEYGSRMVQQGVWEMGEGGREEKEGVEKEGER